MKVIVGKNAGFCYGVENAVNGAHKSLEQYKKIYCLGEIVHNKDVVSELEKKGLETVENIEQVKERTIIRAHGIPKQTYEKAKELNIELVDLTCPSVLRIHKIIEQYNEKGFFIFFIGVHNHPETIGSMSYGEENCALIQTEEEIENAINNLKKSNLKNLLIIAQTTFSLENFKKLSEKISKILEGTAINIEIINSVCNATKIRQEETEELSRNADCMIIIGGKNSSNTKKLYEIACNNCENVFLIENSKELQIDQIQKFETIAIMAGASTPQKSIEQVRLRANGNQ